MKTIAMLALLTNASAVSVASEPPEPWEPVPLTARIDTVAPMTGIVVWADSPQAESDAVQLEFSYLLYRDVVDADGRYDWSSVDALLERIAARGHQAVLRFRFVYPGFDETAVPDFIKKLPDYQETVADSEGKPTAFCDWSHPALQRFALDFHAQFAERYDHDPRLAFVQTGFGLWAEYHIYDGPMELGKTFPSKAYQAEFLRHLDGVYEQTPWNISKDAAAAVRTPFAEQPELLTLGFGVFDDSFLHETHADYNETCWNFFGRDRWQTAPAGGEFSYYTDHDQREALAPDGPHGEAFADAAARFHISYMIGNDQPRYRAEAVIRQASMATGYRFVVETLETDGQQTRATVRNTGVAPMYYDVFPAIGETRSETSLKGLLPGAVRTAVIPAAGDTGVFRLACDRLVDGQRVPFAASLDVE